ncbi:MAG: deoxynucleoside kinase [Bacteroidetes bacterium]|nr:deoxynucleoside kinase [Bacteroidota bacterium]MBS1628657.1 deoxynucleoside kinase [Bacteroidota bacterium]
MKPRYIAIEGNIGAGKTTLARLLAERLHARLILEEFSDNAFLPKFYEDPARWAFPLELSFLADRYKQLKEFLATPDLFAQPVISDYLFIKSRLFAKINLEEAEYQLFSKMYALMELHLPRPEVLLFLHAPLATLQAHIRERGRAYEQNIDSDYLLRVGESYQEFLNSLPIPILILDSSCLDFRDEPQAIEALIAQIDSGMQPGIQYFPWIAKG